MTPPRMLPVHVYSGALLFSIGLGLWAIPAGVCAFGVILMVLGSRRI
jgi:hypothetical protein